MMPGFDPMLLLVLNLAGTFAFGLSGMACVRARLDLFGVVVLAVVVVAYPFLSRIGGPIDVLDAAGLGLFCVTGASTALDHGLAAAPAVILGAITASAAASSTTSSSARSPSCSERGFTRSPF